MRVDKLDQMVRGWFVGDFSPVAYRSSDFEVGVKRFAAGESETPHVHKIITEVNCVISGRVQFNGKEFGAGDIITIEPSDACAFRSITESVIVVVKSPSIPSDKHVVEDAT
jgi:mannose-6-phosphate isomerase-like protein (cupin superfamily)